MRTYRSRLQVVSCLVVALAFTTAFGVEPYARTTGSAPLRVESGGLGLADGSITGTVTDADTGEPLANATVRLYNEGGNPLNSATTDASGLYTIGALAAGTYYLRASSAPDYIDAYYGGVQCPGPACTYGAFGIEIPVTDGQETGGIDFALSRGDAIAGTVTDADTGAPVANVPVLVMYQGTNTFNKSASTNSSGAFVLSGLPPGPYYIKTRNAPGHIDELYSGVVCASNCITTSGTLVTVAAGTTTTGVDFALGLGGTISGTVTDADTGTPLSGVQIHAYDANNASMGSVTTNSSGAYSKGGLLPGTYYLKTSNSLGYIDERYADQPCAAGCAPFTEGMGVAVAAGATEAGVDFALALGGTIAGGVTDASSGAPLANVSVYAFDSGGNLVGPGATTDASGNFASAGLPTGTYYLRTANTLGYLDELYNDVACPAADCPSVTTGTGVSATAGSTKGGVSFALNAGITGPGMHAAPAVLDFGSVALGSPGVERSLTVTNTGNQPLSGWYWSLPGGPVGGTCGSSAANPSGLYSLVPGQSCTFLLRFTPASVGPTGGSLYIGMRTAAAPSGSPDVTWSGSWTANVLGGAATPGMITGTVTDATSGAPLAGVTVQVYDSGNSLAASPSTDASGSYASASLAPGTYYLKTSNSLGYADELFNNLPCAGGTCTATAGNGVAVAAGAATHGINFVLAATQPGSESATVSPAAWSVPTAGGARTITVIAAPGTSWTASTDQPWLTVTPTTGSGSGSVTLSASALPSAAERIAAATIAGQAVAVVQNPRQAVSTVYRTPADPVIVTMNYVDDSAVIRVNGVVRLSKSFSNNPQSLDVTPYLSAGVSTVQLEISNGGAGWSYGWSVMVNGTPAVSDQCATWNVSGCLGNDYTTGLVFTHLVQVNTVTETLSASPTAWNAPPAGGTKAVTVTDLKGTETWTATAETVVTTLAGSPTGAAADIDGTGTAASFNIPNHVALDAAGNVYVAEYSGHRIRKVTPAGVVTPFAGSGVAGGADGAGAAASFDSPRGIAIDAAGTLYVTEVWGHRVRRISPEGVVTTVAGNGSPGFVDGLGTAAQFRYPSGIAVDRDGNLYVAEEGNATVRRITPEGAVTTLAGNGTAGYADGTGAAARFSTPFGLAIDAAGSLYVADSGNNRIRKVTPAGVVTTLAGSGTAGSADGSGTAAQFNDPWGLAIDTTGTIYVADLANGRIRRISPDLTVATFVGSDPGYTDGTAAAARFTQPVGVALSAEESFLIVAERNGGNRVRRVTLGADWLTAAPAGGTGSGSVTLTAAPSASTRPRTAAATVAGKTVTVVQAPGAAIGVVADAVDFGTSYAGAAGIERTVTVTNIGAVALSGWQWNSTGLGDPAALVCGGAATNPNDPYSLEAGGSCTLVLRFVPTVAGLQGGALGLGLKSAPEGSFDVTWAGTWTATVEPPLIAIGALNQVFNGMPRTVTAETTPAGLAVTVTYAGAGGTTYGPSATPPMAAGTYTVTATTSFGGSQVGTLAVAPAVPSVSWPAPAAVTYGTALSATQLNATADVAGSFVYTPAAGTVLAAGTHTLAVTFTPTDAANYAGATASVAIDVAKAAPSVSWPAPAVVTYGTALSATQLNATAEVPGTFVYAPALGTVLNAGAGQALAVTFTPTDAANYAGATASVAIDVAKATPSVSWPAPAAVTYGTALSATQLNATADVAGSFVYTPAAGTVLAAGTHTLAVTFTPTDAANYAGAMASVAIDVAKATPLIIWAAPTAPYGTALSATQLNATANVPGSFVYTPAAGTVLAAGTRTLAVTFTPTDAANYTGASSSVAMAVTFNGPSSGGPSTGSVSGSTLTYSGATYPIVGGKVTFPDCTVYIAMTSGMLIPAGTAAGCTPGGGGGGTAPVAPTLAWATPAAVAAGTALSGAQLNATADVAGSFVYTPAAGTVLAAGTHTLAVTFTPADPARYTTASRTVALTVTASGGGTFQGPNSGGPSTGSVSGSTLTYSGATYPIVGGKVTFPDCTVYIAMTSGMLIPAGTAAGCTPGGGGVTPTRVIALSGDLNRTAQVGSSATATLTIRNTGNAILTVTAIVYPSGFTGNWGSGSIAPGASHAVTVTFAPTAAQAYGGFVTVISDATAGTNTIAASGTGTPAAATRIIGLSGTLAFGGVQVGSSASAILTITNTGNAPLTVTGLVVSSALVGVSSANWTSGTIAAGGSQQVLVQFAPLAAQSYSGTLTVTSNATGGTNTIAMSGSGTSVIAYHVWGGPNYQQYLGYVTCLFCTEYGADSINNQYGSYGNPYSSTSIRNAYSQYGNPYSTYSACNEFASQPPRVYDTSGTVYYGELTLNPYRPGAITATNWVSWLRNDVCGQ